MNARAFFLACALAPGLALFSQKKTPTVWEELNQNHIPEAQTLLRKSEKKFNVDHFVTDIYLKSYRGQQASCTDFGTRFYDQVENPYPYLYALWFNNAALGVYGKKKYPHQTALMDRILSDPKAHGTLVAAAHYQKGMHLMYSNKRKEAQAFYNQVGSIRNWQYVGPFENLSQSGFSKENEHGPLARPEPGASFISSTNAPIRWFTPSAENPDGWTPVCFQVNKATAVTYAQTFVESPEDQEVLLNAGASGAIKIWVNDALVFSEYKEQTTEMDAYTVKTNLQKGSNRILVQLSYTNSGYPNFIIRLTDRGFRPIPGFNGNAEFRNYKKAGSSTPPQPLPHFAEAFFSREIEQDSSALVNYLLLTDVYLRHLKLKDARNTMEAALRRAPNNNIVRMKLLDVLLKEENRAQTLEELERIKLADPECLLALEEAIKEAFENEKFEEANRLNNRIEELYGKNETTASYRISILAREQKFDELVKTAEETIKKYPDLASLLELAYSIKKEVYKDIPGGLQAYENFLKTNFDADVIDTYATLLKEQGQTEKSLQLRKDFLEGFPYDPGSQAKMANYYYAEKQYKEAEKYIRKALALSPYHETYWASLGDIKSELKEKKEAVEAFETSLTYNPNQYEVINKIRKLNGKSETYQLIPEPNIKSLIEADRAKPALNSEYGYYLILDEKNMILYPGGAAEEYSTFMVKITSEKGIDYYKESSIGYGNNQDLLIEKAEIHKSSGVKIDGERSGNEIVFTNLEVGDVVVFKYRRRNYVSGRFAKEFWDTYMFNSQVFTSITNYRLLVPSDIKLQYKITHSDIKPAIRQVEGFTEYVWNLKSAPVLKDEPLSPVNVDVGIALHLSTLGSWKEIASWYADITHNKKEEGYEIVQLFGKLLPEEKAKSMTEWEKARVIYEYIANNIRYSSVAFRQGAYVPQSAAITLNTRLGDCKDLSNLFVTLCRMAGIESQLVLVNTRENGIGNMLLPSLEFNHCIAKARLDGKEHYIELTNNYLPFGSLPRSLPGALMLEIPSGKMAGSETITQLNPVHKSKDIVRRKMQITPVGEDLKVKTKSVQYGHPSSNIRGTYRSMDYKESLNRLQEAMAGSFTGNLTMDTVYFSGLETLDDSVSFTYGYSVKNQVTEIGSLKAFKIPYPDVVASLNSFSAEERTLPIEYTDYEDIDEYKTETVVELPAGMVFIDVPKTEQLQYGKMTYTLAYQLSAPDKLNITRTFVSDRKRIPASDYAVFKTFFEKIVKAEQKMIAYKEKE